MSYTLAVKDLSTLPPAHEVLCPGELAFFNSLKVQKRKDEWLGGRLALKKLLYDFAGCVPMDVAILAPDGVSKPVISVLDETVSTPFSLTHSNGFAVAALAPEDKYIGIDLEKVVPRIHAWKTDFFHPTELTQDDDAFLTTLWTQKEALLKMLGPGLTINTRDVRIVGGKPQFFGRALEIYQSLGTPPITLQTRPLIPGFCFSVAVA